MTPLIIFVSSAIYGAIMIAKEKLKQISDINEELPPGPENTKEKSTEAETSMNLVNDSSCEFNNFANQSQCVENVERPSNASEAQQVCVQCILSI